MGSTIATVDLINSVRCKKMTLKSTVLLMLVVSLHLGLVKAGFRCTLGQWACTASCVTLGQTSGTCDALGRTDGKCVVDSDGANDCQCSDKFVSGSQFALCAAESTCRLDCQRRQFATGDCVGWSCECRTTNEPVLAADIIGES